MKIQSFILLSIALAVLLFSYSCDTLAPFFDEDVETPWEHMQDRIANADTVVITDIQPTGEAAKTASIFTIYGENFQPEIDNVKVYFGSTPVKVLSATTDSIKVYRPKVSGDDIIVKVACHDRINVAHYYGVSIAEVVSDWGIFVTTEYINDLTFDTDTNMFVYLSGDTNLLVKFECPGQIRKDDWGGNLGGSYGLYAPVEMKVEKGLIAYTYGGTALLRVGSDGSNYDHNKVNNLSTTPKKTGREFDYAENGDIYVGGIGLGIVHIPTNGANKTYNLYADFKIMSLRIYNGYVYVIANPQKVEAGVYGLYRNAIEADGSLGATEMVLNWEALRSNSGDDLYDLTFSESGIMYLGTSDNHAPLMSYKDGVLEPFYYDIVTSPVNEMEWGPDGYLYVVVKKTLSVGQGCKILKINLGEKGAPYYGR
ncbi:MAG: IPT/TIG domain-containing protein [Candidatus Marinimicrobia bacterium]|jgi:hypothetical protein|nr:IPT/TIG domain-containing protein [Candidatus Neomarinimicrobiota bacterium]